MEPEIVSFLFRQNRAAFQRLSGVKLSWVLPETRKSFKLPDIKLLKKYKGITGQVSGMQSECWACIKSRHGRQLRYHNIICLYRSRDLGCEWHCGKRQKKGNELKFPNVPRKPETRLAIGKMKNAATNLVSSHTWNFAHCVHSRFLGVHVEQLSASRRWSPQKLFQKCVQHSDYFTHQELNL